MNKKKLSKLLIKIANILDDSELEEKAINYLHSIGRFNFTETELQNIKNNLLKRWDNEDNFDDEYYEDEDIQKKIQEKVNDAVNKKVNDALKGLKF